MVVGSSPTGPTPSTTGARAAPASTAEAWSLRVGLAPPTKSFLVVKVGALRFAPRPDPGGPRAPLGFESNRAHSHHGRGACRAGVDRRGPVATSWTRPTDQETHRQWSADVLVRLPFSPIVRTSPSACLSHPLCGRPRPPAFSPSAPWGECAAPPRNPARARTPTFQDVAVAASPGVRTSSSACLFHALCGRPRPLAFLTHCADVPVRLPFSPIARTSPSACLVFFAMEEVGAGSIQGVAEDHDLLTDLAAEAGAKGLEVVALPGKVGERIAVDLD